MQQKKKTRRTKKPKVVLNKKQVILLTSAIIFVCVCMLVVSIATIPSEKNYVAKQEVNLLVENTQKNKLEDTSQKESLSSKNESVTHAASKKTEKAIQSASSKTTNSEMQTTSKKTEATTQTSSSSNNSSSVAQTTSAKTESVTKTPSSSKVVETTTQPTSQEVESLSTVTAFDSVQNAENNATLVLVLDDGGQNLTHLQYFLDLPFDFDVAVLPKLQYSKETAFRVRMAGKEVMLHQPMQAKNLSVNPGPGAITPEMHTYEIETLVTENLLEVGPVAGLNNHEGSLITESVSKIGAVLDVCKSHEIFFLDSRTTAETQASYAAMERGMHIWERDIFLDNTQHRDDIINQILQAVKVANRDGYAIMIGHVWSANNLASILLEMYNALEPKGYKFSNIRGLYENFGN